MQIVYIDLWVHKSQDFTTVQVDSVEPDYYRVDSCATNPTAFLFISWVTLPATL